MKLKGIERALEYGRIKQGVGHPRIDFLAGYNKAIEDTKAVELLEMLNRIVFMTSACEGTFADFRERYNIEIENLIKQVTELTHAKEDTDR